MKFWMVIASGLRRKPLRTLFTFLSVVVAFNLFGVLAAISNGFAGGIEVAGEDRLMTSHNVSLVILLPERYQEQIAEISGVKAVAFSFLLPYIRNYGMKISICLNKKKEITHYSQKYGKEHPRCPASGRPHFKC